ncbi:hypothetical protein [Kosakonia pseudosacchari]|uniref:hypothetical protein n=1 Tax=Kosakonia pseudosacchari TaxID=1646340 RepID=UPI000A3722C9|nr:hypothetical protein [Kosakonia pseudosacchari]
MFCSDDSIMRLGLRLNKNPDAQLPPTELGSGHSNNRHDEHNDGCLSHENSFAGDNRQKSIV